MLPPLLLVCVACGAGSTATGRHVAVSTPDHVRAVSATSSAGQPVDASAFSPGACVAFSPTASARHLTVFLVAGHGGLDLGAVGGTESGRTIYEADETLAVELDTMAILRAAGFRVVVSRTRDTSVLRLGPGDVAGGVLTVGALMRMLWRETCAPTMPTPTCSSVSTSTLERRSTPAL